MIVGSGRKGRRFAGALLALLGAFGWPLAARCETGVKEEAGVKVRGPFRRIASVGPEAAFSPPDGSTIYQNETEPQFHSNLWPNSVLEEITVVTNTSPLEIDSIELAFEVQTAVPVKIVVRLWNVVNPAATPVNSGLLGTETIDLGATPYLPGLYIVGETLAIPIILSDNDIGVQIDFFNSVTGVPLAGEASVVFAGGGPSVGSSPDRYFRDANSNGQFDPGDTRTFAGNPGLANFMLHLRGLMNPNAIDPGIDLFQTPTNGVTYQNFVAEPSLFDSCSPGLGYSSLGFTQNIPLKTRPLVTDPPEVLAPADTILVRRDLVFVNNPNDVGSTSVSLAALSLQSVSPVQIDFSNGTTTISGQWNVFVCLSSLPQPLGTMNITRGACVEEGGTFTVPSLPVLPKLIFSRIGTPTCVVTVDQGVRGAPPIDFSFSGHWLNYDPLNFNLIQEPIGGIVQADGNCDGVFENALPATSDTFHPGVRVLRCSGVSCATPGSDPASRRTPLTATGAAQMLLPATESGSDADADTIIDVSDNCGGVFPLPPGTLVANPQQQDADDDGFGDACDNCVSVCNLEQTNTDGDAFGDACDCNVTNPLDPKPGEALNLRCGLDKRTWTWNTEAISTSYNLIRGAIVALPVGPGGAEEVCLGNPATPSWADATNPPVGNGFFYVARGKNACGGGTYGRQGVRGVVGVERVSTTCP